MPHRVLVPLVIAALAATLAAPANAADAVDDAVATTGPAPEAVPDTTGPSGGDLAQGPATVDADGVTWTPTPDADSYISGDPETVAIISAGIGVAGGGGYSLYSGAITYRSSYNVWLSEGPYADAVQPHLLAAIVAVNPYVGNRLVWKGRTAPRPSGSGEIVVQPTAGGSPCSGASVIGCGGISYSGGFVDSGRVWIHESVWGYPEWVRRTTVLHEFGHALGLSHFDGTWEGRYQTMRSSVADQAMVDYGAGDLNGLLDMANLDGPRSAPPPPPPPAPLPSCPSVGHFSAQRAAKPSVFRPGNGTWYVQQLDSGGNAFGGPGDSPCAADYDGNGVDELAVFRPGDGRWYVKGVAEAGVAFGSPGDVPVAANYDGRDGQNLAVFRPSTGVWYAFGQDPVAYGGPGDQPVPGDYNGDGKDDVAVFRAATGRWYVNAVLPGGIAFGGPGDVPVMSDFNGDGRADLAVYRNAVGMWFVDTNRDGSADQVFAFGSPGDAPVPADFNGDGRADAAVFRPSNGRWYVRGFDEAGTQFGGPGDVPGMRTNR